MSRAARPEAPALTIGRASRQHSAVLVELATRTFRQAFASANTVADIESYLAKAFAPQRLNEELADRTSIFLLAWLEAAAGPVGYAKLKVGRLDPSISGNRPIELERLYVERAALGRGVGSGLMRACLEEARIGEYATLWLGVWEHNPRAIAFYRRWQFAEVGEHLFRLGSDEQRDIIMQRPV